jgi:hypothetical protein
MPDDEIERHVKGEAVPRIIVTSDAAEQDLRTPVLLDEHVDFVNLCEDHAAEELIARLGWALADADDVERAA